MTTQDSTQAGGWVGRAMELADLASQDTASQEYDKAAQKFELLRAHLTTHASQQAAVVAGLAEASAEPLRLLGALRVAMHWPELEAQMKAAEEKLRAAIAAYHAMKEKQS